MDTEKRELWDRLENEPERAYRAFESFLSLPSSERTLLAAYRQHVDNPDVTKPSDTYSGWSRRFAWRERAAAYDDHLASLRRDAYERVIEEGAERQAREVEKIRYRYNELMTMAYVQAAEWLENAQPSDLRGQDVMRIIGLHLDYVKAFEVDRESTDEDDWSEEDLAAGEQIVKEIEAQPYLEHPDLGEEDWEGSEEDLEEGRSEEGSEDGEGEQG
jgi:hypothetical protein